MSKGITEAERFALLVESVGTALPHLIAWLDARDEFVELRLKMKPDGTILAIAKGFGVDGGPVVCFGLGYGALGSLLAINASIQGGNWRFDKPWEPPAK